MIVFAALAIAASAWSRITIIPGPADRRYGYLPLSVELPASWAIGLHKDRYGEFTLRDGSKLVALILTGPNENPASAGRDSLSKIKASHGHLILLKGNDGAWGDMKELHPHLTEHPNIKRGWNGTIWLSELVAFGGQFWSTGAMDEATERAYVKHVFESAKLLPK